MNMLHCLKSFLAVVDYKNFSAAARNLHISSSKISKQITWLEDELKIKLLVRSTTSLVLTEKGYYLYKQALILFEQLGKIKAIGNTEKLELKGSLRIYFTVTPMIPYLTSLSIEFIKMHPKLEINIDIGYQAVDVYSSEFDLAMTFDRVTNQRLVCTQLFSVQRKIFASPTYLKEHGIPEKLQDIEQHRCLINTLYGLQNKWIFKKNVISVTGNFKSNNADLLKQAAINGMGLIWVPCFSVRNEVDAGLLVPVLPDEISPEINLYAIYPKHLAYEEKIRQLLNYFYEQALADEIANN
ncbi:LysR family transcriptional regulator [Legionella sainthelensi]|uniref:LysR family transcriptional regulator n=1 Tax=Legionella sainthelensi TaxID=28087 RepID=UPI000E1FE4BF|nr:LysR family transcriptional regulator [Legionella sainthelensi]